MRIVSLVPHATELLFALGLGDEVIGVTHECDHPPAASELPQITRDVLPQGLTAREIDSAVGERTAEGRAIYELDEYLLGELRPDLIVTQQLCPVCAVAYDEVAALAEQIASRPTVLALDPTTFGETLADIQAVAAATGSEAAGEALLGQIGDRADRVRAALEGCERRPRVAALEWLDPLFAAGHWTPQLIELAGGEDVLGLAGERSERVSWEQLAACRPEIVIAMPCGYDASRARDQALEHAGQLARLGARIVAVDASAYFSRPGPRLIDGLELLAHILHPDLVGPGVGEAVGVDTSASLAGG